MPKWLAPLHHVVLHRLVAASPPAVGAATVGRGVPDPGGEANPGPVHVPDLVGADDQVLVLVGLQVDGGRDPGVEPALDPQVLDGDPGDVVLEVATQDHCPQVGPVTGEDGRSFDGGRGALAVVDVEGAVARLVVPLAVQVERVEVAVEEVPPLRTAVPAHQRIVHGESGSRVGDDVAVHHVPADPLDVHHRPGPVDVGQRGVGDLAGRRLAIDLGVAPVRVAFDVGPPAVGQAPGPLEHLVDPHREAAGIGSGREVRRPSVGPGRGETGYRLRAGQERLVRAARGVRRVDDRTPRGPRAGDHQGVGAPGLATEEPHFVTRLETETVDVRQGPEGGVGREPVVRVVAAHARDVVGGRAGPGRPQKPSKHQKSHRPIPNSHRHASAPSSQPRLETGFTLLRTGRRRIGSAPEPGSRTAQEVAGARRASSVKAVNTPAAAARTR